jgi:PAS domain S-box-containing protein
MRITSRFPFLVSPNKERTLFFLAQGIATVEFITKTLEPNFQLTRCSLPDSLAAPLAEGSQVLIVEENILPAEPLARLMSESDNPLHLVILLTAGSPSPALKAFLQSLAPDCSVTVLGRPYDELALKSHLHTVLRLRRYEDTAQEFCVQSQQWQILKKSEGFFRSVFESSLLGIVFWDSNGRWTDGNEASARMFGYTRKEIQEGGLTWEKITPPEFRQNEEARHKQLEREQRLPPCQMEYQHKNGARIPVLIGSSLLPGHENTGVAFILDITELKETQRTLQQLNETLEGRVESRAAALRDANAQLEAFTYSIAHDLKAPIRAIGNFSSIMLKDCASQIAEPGVGYLHRINNAAHKMDRLVQDLLSYSRIATQDLELRPVSINSLVTELLNRQHQLVVETSAVVKRGVYKGMIVGNCSVLYQALENLFLNAVKFVAPSVKPQIEISELELDGRIRVIIADNGIGIAPENHEKIFKVFERLHTQEDYEGTGIGLAIVKKSLARMGGNAGVESSPGKGSRFWIELPKAETPS